MTYFVLAQNESLQSEISDLQAEFEFDRIDYLDTIRRLEQELAWKDEIVSRIHPTLRRDSNYFNLDKIRVRTLRLYDGCWTWLLISCAVTVCLRFVILFYCTSMLTGDKHERVLYAMWVSTYLLFNCQF